MLDVIDIMFNGLDKEKTIDKDMETQFQLINIIKNIKLGFLADKTKE